MNRLFLGAAASALCLSAQAFAGVGVDVSAGTPGLSGNVHWQVTPFVTLRGGYNYFEFEMEEQSYDDIEYDVDLNFSQLGGYVDIHPLMNGLTITGGVLQGERSIDLISRPTMPIEIGGQVFTPEQVGDLVGSANFGDLAYYGGVGWDSTTHGLLPVSLVLRVGVIVTDSPDISLVSVGGLASSDPVLEQMVNDELAVEVEQLESDFQDFQYFPMVSFGLGFGF